MKCLNLVLIDFFDSFTFNLVQVFTSMGHNVETRAYCDVLQKSKELLAADLVILGPGPGHVDDYSEFIRFIDPFREKQVFLGICLGHQILGSLNKYELKQIVKPIHGQSLPIDNTIRYLLRGEDEPDWAIREDKAMFYNSWTLEASQHSRGEYIIENNQVTMIDLSYALGLQFHPESVGTSCPIDILSSALRIVYNKKNDGPTSNYWSV